MQVNWVLIVDIVIIMLRCVPFNIPSSELCLNCHNYIKTDSPHGKKIKESFDNNEPIEWVKVHMLPDYAYFNHSRHVNSGILCSMSCRVDQMEVVRRASLSMSWCLECHRNPEEKFG